MVRPNFLRWRGLAGLSAVAILALFVYARKPYIEVTEERATSVPQTVQVTWFLRCENDYYEGSDNQQYQPRVPAGGEPVGIGPVMSAGTKFMLVGYPYAEVHRNRFTGKVAKRRSDRFDVIEWHVVPPYKTWNGENYVESNAPVGWKSDGVSVRFDAQLDRSRKPC